MNRFSRLVVFGLLIPFLFVLHPVIAAEHAEVLFTGQPSETVKLTSSHFTGSVSADIRLDFGESPSGIEPNEKFNVRLVGERILVEVGSSGRLLIAQGTPEVRRDRTGTTVKLVARYGFSFYDLTPLNRALETSLTKFLIKDGKLFFEAAPDLFDLGLAIRLEIGKRRFLLRDRTIYDRLITGGSFTRTPTEDGKVLYYATLADLGLPVPSHGRFNVTLSGNVVFTGESILNPAELRHDGKIVTSLRLRARKLASEEAWFTEILGFDENFESASLEEDHSNLRF